MSRVISVIGSDIHLSHEAPAARSNEPDWYKAQSRPLDQVRQLCSRYDCPFIIAGDIFHHWKSVPETINFALDKFNFPAVSIAGQHDLPMHNYGELYRSAYKTLVLAGRLKDISEGGVVEIYSKGTKIKVVGYSWGNQIEPWLGVDRSIAISHSYVWTDSCSYVGASEENNISMLKGKLEGFAAAAFGDNHHGFLRKSNGIDVLNCGCLIRRRSEERNRPAYVGLLFDDLHIERYELDTSEDLWLDECNPEVSVAESIESNLDGFLKELSDISVDSLDYRQALHSYLRDNKVSDSLRSTIVEILGE